MTDECKHIFGYEEGVGYESWLVYEPTDPKRLEVQFKFCPLCGEELIIEMLE